MAFHGRPALVPGIPLPSPMGMGAYMPPMIPSVMTMPSMMSVRPFRPRNNNHKLFSEAPRRGAPESGPPITVFIGNIVEHAPDLMIKHTLATCGQVISWKRTQGFGFCEFGSPSSALRAIRVLHDRPIGTKKLVVKVDANTTVKLNEYKKSQRKKQGKPDVPEGPNLDMDLEDYIDDQTRHADHRCLSTIYQILKEYQEEMENALMEKQEEMQFTKEIIQNLPDPKRAQRSQDILTKLARDTNEKGVGKDDLEDGKRELITREIGKFREIMKKQEAEREEERLRREQEKHLEKAEKGRSRSKSRSLSTVRSVRSARSPRSPSASKAASPEPRHRPRRPRSHSRSRDRDRERERDRDRDRERDRDQPKSRQSKRDLDRAAARQLEEQEEDKERKKLEKKTREKEVAYQERVRMWESRERRKRKDFEKEKDKKLQKEEGMAKEAKKLKEFLEDYDDERDDAKYYKGRELVRLTDERDRERESDNKDRLREKEEIEELRNKVLESEHVDPTGVYEQLLQEHENMYKPKIIIDVNAEQMVRQREREKEREKERETEMRALEEEKRRKEAELLALGAKSNNVSPSDDDDDDRGADFGPASNHNSPSDNEESSVVNSSAAVGNKKKKLDVKDVFNADEDEDSVQGPKRRKLVPLDYDEKEKKPSKDRKKKDHHKKDDKKGDENSKSTEEKRKHVKSLIDKIPTDKGALFEYTIDWTMVDNILMEKRIRPWINKKIIEYIGEPEPTLVDFICSKVLAGSQPQGILDDVQMVLDEEAEIFVVKMWRLLIYEIEAKKMGFVK